jgi:Fe-S cluster biogenesis protein NfuA
MHPTQATFQMKHPTYEEQRLKVRMSGACEGCNLAPVTLHGWVEGTVKQFFPHLEGVVAVD